MEQATNADRIRVVGATTHNLRNVDLDLSRGELTVFVGPSGSGKSSLAFDTLHAESRRRYLAALGMSSDSTLERPPVRAVMGLPPTLALPQLATETGDLAAVADVRGPLGHLAGTFGTLHCPICGDPIIPTGHDAIVDAIQEMEEGTRITIEVPVELKGAAALKEVARAGFSRVRIGLEIYRVDEVRKIPRGSEVRIVIDRIKLRPGRRDRLDDAVRTASRASSGVLIVAHPLGELRFVDRPWCARDSLALPDLQPSLFGRSGACPACEGKGHIEGTPCLDCQGSGLDRFSRAVTVAGLSMGEAYAGPLHGLTAALRQWKTHGIAEELRESLLAKLSTLEELGLGELPLHRQAKVLSTSEMERARAVRLLSTDLSGVLYIFDEPCAGLDHDAAKTMAQAIRRLTEGGNGVVAVSHRKELMQLADRIVEFGPGRGSEGGELVYDGSFRKLKDADTATGRWLSGDILLETLPKGRKADIAGVTVGLGGVTRISGPSASGKTRLLRQVAKAAAENPALHGVLLADATAARRSRRSTPGSYVGVWDRLRDLLAATPEAAVRGLTPSHFSLNVKGGRCEACAGLGQRRVDLGHLPPAWVPCGVCGGRRFHADVLKVRWRGYNAGELLDLDVRQARALLGSVPAVDRALRAMLDAGLGHLRLGQPLHTLSGGEAQRLRLARELAKLRKDALPQLVAFDEPTLGLHPGDLPELVRLLRAIADAGHAVVVATHERMFQGGRVHVLER